MAITAEKREVRATAYWTIEEAAAYCRVSRPTMYRLAKAKLVPAVRIGGSIRVPVEEFTEWLSIDADRERRKGSAVGPGSSVDTPAERDGTSNEREAVEPAQLAGEGR